ncbi:MAG: type IV secretory system conjugative DNA transfer family protein [Oscillospiraceae bacterium]|nr:type IV secretory system conjugative DNA transfer family protein [Oscillospiraceae bacterium]
MDLTTKTLAQIPPIVALSGDKIMVSGSVRDIHAWLELENIHRSNAFIIHDPCGCLIKRYRRELECHYYETKVFDTTCGAESARYNPFLYVRDSAGVTELADAVLRGTTGNTDYDDYGFLLAEWLLLKTLFGYVNENAPDVEMNFKTVLDMLERMEICEDWDGFKTAVDLLFEELEERDPFNLTLLRYKHFKATPYAKDNKVVDSCKKRLASLVTKQALAFMSKDELRFNDLSHYKVAIFVRSDENCSHLALITPLMYAQFFRVAYERAVN